MKAIWNGAIGFGLVNILVKIYSAAKPDLDMFDDAFVMQKSKIN